MMTHIKKVDGAILLLIQCPSGGIHIRYIDEVSDYFQKFKKILNEKNSSKIFMFEIENINNDEQ